MADDIAAAEKTTEQAIRRLQRWWAVAGAVLFIATRRLWTPQTSFPQIPLVGWAGSLPPAVDWIAVGVLGGSLISAAIRPNSGQSWSAFVVSLCVLCVLDQHRLQPWAWQLGLMALCWSSASRSAQSGLALLRLLTISIYFWSAISKLDVDFFLTHGQTLITALFRSIGIHVAQGPTQWKYWLAHVFPIGEMLVAIGLCWSRTRRVALYGATLLHLALILTLGPTGLGHRPGVLLWNMTFIGHDWFLFGLIEVRPQVTQSVSERAALHVPIILSRPHRAAEAVILFACVWPMTERWDLCDRWLAWSVYSARGERVSVILTDEGVRRLSEIARILASQRELWLDQWSFAALDVPIYPQLRFQLGAVESLRQMCGEENLIEVMIQHSQGNQPQVERLTIEQMDALRRAFWINTRPRDRSPANNPR